MPRDVVKKGSIVHRANVVFAFIGLSFLDAASAAMLSSAAVSTFDIGGHAFFSGTIYVAVASLISFMFILAAPKIRSLLEHPISLFAAATLCGFGLCAFAFGSQSTYAIISLCLFSCGCTILLLYWLELFITFSPLELILVIIGASAADGIATCIVNTVNHELLVCVFCLLLAFACVMFVDKKQKSHESFRMGVQSSAVGLDRRSLVGVLVGLLIVGLSVAYSQHVALREGRELPAYSEVVQVIIFGYMLWLLYFRRDINLSMALKTIATLASLSLLLLLFSDSLRYAAYSISSVAYGILSYSALYVSVLIAKSHSSIRLRVLALVQCVLSFSAPLFIAIALLGIDISSEMFLVTVAFILACASIWLLSDRSIDMLTSSRRSSLNNARETDFSAKARAVGNAVGLTPREFDIFSLSAMGRSAPYIAEKLVISENTVKSYLQKIYSKCEVHSRQELISLVENFDE